MARDFPLFQRLIIIEGWIIHRLREKKRMGRPGGDGRENVRNASTVGLLTPERIILYFISYKDI